jgi:hypothetical protein
MKIDWKKEIKLPKPSLSGVKRFLSADVKAPSLKKSSSKKSTEPVAAATPVAAQPVKASASKSKRPSLKRPKSLSTGPQVKVPGPVADLYGDLRDRHLLPLVALLIAAIVVAPILLNKSGDSKAEAPAVAPLSTGNEASGSSFSVVPAARRLRSPEKRLAHRKPLDPFRMEEQKQKQQEKEGGSKSSGGKEGGSNNSGGGGEPTSTGTVTTGTAPVTTESTPPRNAELKVTETPDGGKEVTIRESTSSTPPASEPATGEAASTPGSTGASEGATAGTEIVGYQIAIKAGDPTGELKEEGEIVPLTKLPTAKNPLVVFTGLSQDDKRALFLMTSKVTAYYGAVHCVVDKQACQMIELTPGKPATFEYFEGETAAKYKVVVEAIEPVTKAQAGSERNVETTVRKTTTVHPAEAKSLSPTPRGYALSTAHRFSK